jgi:hypothetical protein
MKQKNLVLLITLVGILSANFLTGCKRCTFCGDSKASYDTLYMGVKDKCDLIVLRKKETIDKGFLWPKTPIEIKTEPIKPDTAIKYIKLYNEYDNHDLTQTTFIDFDISKLMNYLTNSSFAGNTDTLRIYMAKDESGKNKMILVCKNSKGDFYDEDKNKPIDYGGLCPPPDPGCVNTRNATLLLKAIEQSNATPLPLPLGRTRIVKP